MEITEDMVRIMAARRAELPPQSVRSLGDSVIQQDIQSYLQLQPYHIRESSPVP